MALLTKSRRPITQLMVIVAFLTQSPSENAQWLPLSDVGFIDSIQFFMRANDPCTRCLLRKLERLVGGRSLALRQRMRYALVTVDAGIAGRQ
jgi:hypothetical protein